MEIPTRPSTPKGKEPELIRQPRILLIDHDSVATRLTKNVIQRSTTSDVVSVTTLQDADTLLLEERSKKTPFDVIISAYRFPSEKLNGVEFARRVRQGNWVRNPLFVLQTSDVAAVKESYTDQQLRDQGVDEVFDREALSEKVIQWLQRLELQHAIKSLPNRP